MRVELARLASPGPAEEPFEMVERKGLGHPDTVCDALAEATSVALCRHYLGRFGQIFHHNVDKALLVGGAARPAFGGGEVLEPIEITIAGRATTAVRGEAVPVVEIAEAACRAWLAEHLRGLDVARHLRLAIRIRPSSSELVGLFERQRARGVALANDTSFGVGYAPLDALERAVLAATRRLNDPATRDRHPFIGEDVKVMGARSGEGFRLTVACALIGRHLADLPGYFAAKAEVARLAAAAAAEAGAEAAEVAVNTADGETADSVYLTVTGTSAEAGDDGQVGRGNRCNGLITPYRPMSLEAAAGKNPVSHVGKLYNLLAGRIAAAVVEALPEVREAECHLLSRIGQPIDEPQLLHLGLRLHPEAELAPLAPRIEAIARERLGGVGTLWQEVLAGRCPVW